MEHRMPIERTDRRRGRTALALLGLLMLAGCAATDPREDATDPTRPAGARFAENDRAQGPIELGGEQGDSENSFQGTETFPGTGVFVNRDAANAPAPLPDGEGEVTLNFEGQGIQEVIHAILGHMLQENYVIAPGISGEVTFSTARPVTRDQILPILEMLLRWNGATLIWREDRYHVLPIAEAVRGNLTPRIGGQSIGRGYQVVGIPLDYIAPTQMATILEPYAREDAVLNTDNARSLLMLAGTPAELRNYIQIIDTFDVDWLAGMSVGIFEITRVEVADLATELEAVLGDMGGEGDSPLAGLFRIMPMERLNSIMVITPQERYLDEVQKWIDRLDRSSPEAGARLYVYRVKNLDADVLAGYLANVFGGEGGGSSASQRQSRGGLAPGLEQATASSVSQFQNETGPQARASTGGAQRSGGGGTVTLGEDGGIRITAVLETNSLLIQASPSEYDSILNAIERLDEQPLQVLIEAQVLQVVLNDALEFGVSWFLQNSGMPSLPDGFVGSNDLNFAQFGDGFGGFQSAVTPAGGIGSNYVGAVIDLLDSVSDTRTISAPSLMVRNNAQATINVGSQIPVQSQSFIGGTDTGSRLGTTQYINTGTVLDVTPRVNPGGLVYLTVSQEVSSPGDPPTSDNPNVAINTRNVTTEVAVQSGQTIVLGGLIAETNGISSSGLPGLSRIPLIGGLFGRRGRTQSREETLVLITPTVIQNTAELEEISREFEKKFKGLEPIAGGFQGIRD
jgi:general secretion pathway protein D